MEFSPPYTLIEESLFSFTLERAQRSPRRRMNYNFHALSEVYQRFLNVLLRGTYVRPHRHFLEPKPETFLSIRGDLGFLLFEEDGSIRETFRISHNGPLYGIDLKPGIWHSLVALSEVCICFEGKSGPYDPSTDKEFLPMYPEEGSFEAREVLAKWEKLF